MRVAQIEIDAVGAREAVRLVLHLVFEIEHHRAGVGRGPVAHSGDAGKLRQLLRGRGGIGRLVGLGSCVGSSACRHGVRRREHRWTGNGQICRRFGGYGLERELHRCERSRCRVVRSSASTRLRRRMRWRSRCRSAASGQWACEARLRLCGVRLPALGRLLLLRRPRQRVFLPLAPPRLRAFPEWFWRARRRASLRPASFLFSRLRE